MLYLMGGIDSGGFRRYRWRAAARFGEEQWSLAA
jgi:hypothetical protein